MTDITISNINPKESETVIKPPVNTIARELWKKIFKLEDENKRLRDKLAHISRILKDNNEPF